jgi:hypothetical protein
MINLQGQLTYDSVSGIAPCIMIIIVLPVHATCMLLLPTGGTFTAVTVQHGNAGAVASSRSG